jgi:hypothetical protein
MSCEFCTIYQESESRFLDGRFCFQTRSVVNKHHDPCEDITLGNNFWCPNRNCWCSVPMCIAAQTKPDMFPDCVKCSKKDKVLDAKRFVGIITRKKLNQLANGNGPVKKTILRRNT